MKISYNWLQSFFNKKLPSPDKLADLLTFHSFEVEQVKKQDKDWVLDIDVLPNRAHDCLSHLGIAREISVLTKVPLNQVDYSQKIKENSQSVNDLIKIEVEDKKLNPRYTVRAIINIKIGPSAEWVQERLKICGLKPINNIVDIANYVMLETGQPLHAFDADKLAGNTIITRLAQRGEKIVALDKEKYDLDQSILVIADQEKAICIAGIKGGQGPEIDKKTKRVILESANFSAQSIRQTSQKLKLRTDASWRFENQLDPNLTKPAIDMAASLIQEMANGQVLKGVIDIYPHKVSPKIVNLKFEQISRLLGVEIPEKEIISILQKLGFELQATKHEIRATIPTRRLDVSIPEDLIEEVGRVYGFAKIPSQLPKATLIPAKKSEDLIYSNKVKDILANLGFSEVYNYSLVNKDELGLVELLNPVSQEQDHLRSSLIPLLVKNVKENKRYFERVRLFEIGKVFNLGQKQIKEEKRLAGILYPDDFYRLKGVIDTLLNRLGISDIWYNDGSDGKAEIKVGNDLLGWLDQSAFEINFEKLVELATEERIYLPPSKYPAMVRDISLLVDPGTKVVEVLNLINTAGGPLIRDVDLFDIYQGEGVSESKKNLAFHIIFQSDKQTLTDKEVNKLQDKIIKTLEDQGGWEVRKQ